MFSQTENQSLKKETLSERLRQLVRQKDEKTLTKMVQEGLCLNQYILVRSFAKEGDVKSVEFLINKFKGKRSAALCGYACGGHIEQVNQLMAQGVRRNNAIWGYARGGHIEQVNQLIAQGASRHMAVRGYATGGYIEQVNQLIAQGANRNEAVWGYAHAGYVKKVNELIAQGASRDEAVWGYARGGYIEQVDQLIAQGASRDKAVLGYAGFGDVEQVNQLIAQGASHDEAVQGYAIDGYIEQVNQLIAQGASRDEAVQGYASGGYIDQVNDLIERGASRDHAAQGYLDGYGIEQESILRIMVFTDDLKLRELLVEKVKNKNNSLDAEAMLKKATKLNKIGKEYQLDFQQSQALTIIGTREWLLQGPQLIREGVFPYEIFLHITSFLIGLSSHDVEKVLTAVNKKIFMGSVRSIVNNVEMRFFSPEKHLEEQHQAEDSYKKRRTL